MPATQPTSRRTFLGTTASAAAAVPYFAWTNPAFANLSANDRPQLFVAVAVLRNLSSNSFYVSPGVPSWEVGIRFVFDVDCCHDAW